MVVDNLTIDQRSLCMSHVRNKNTCLEMFVFTGLKKLHLHFKAHDQMLPGTPDIVFKTGKLAVFIDGDFWHGYRFPAWRHKVSKFWRKKIQINRDRDQRNFRKLRRMGWKVIRIWQHQIEHDLNGCIDRILSALNRKS